jgi:hypothetical protein
VFFPTDGDNLDAQDKKTLDTFVERQGANVDSGQFEVKIIGFADQRFTDEYNQALSSRRAASVFGYLDGKLTNGLPEDTVLEGRGEEPTETPTCEVLADSRRVEVHLTERQVPKGEQPKPKPPGRKDLCEDWTFTMLPGAVSGGFGAVGFERIPVNFTCNTNPTESRNFNFVGVSLGLSAIPFGAQFSDTSKSFKTSRPVNVGIFGRNVLNHHGTAGINVSLEGRELLKRLTGIAIPNGFAGDLWIFEGPKLQGADRVVLFVTSTGVGTGNLGISAATGPFIRTR